MRQLSIVNDIHTREKMGKEKIHDVSDEWRDRRSAAIQRQILVRKLRTTVGISFALSPWYIMMLASSHPGRLSC